MKKYIIFLAMAAAVLSACKQQGPDTGPSISDDPQGRQLAVVTVNVRGDAAATRADIQTQSGEDKLNSVEVFVFDADRSSLVHGMLESYKKAEASEISGNSATIKFNTTTGRKHIFVIANSGVNGDSPLAETIMDEGGFLAAISEFSDNASGSFIMAGSGRNSTNEAYEPVLSAGSAGANNITVEIKRIVARVKLENITGALTSPAFQKTSFRVKRVFLTNVPRQAKYCNGDWTDVFGAVNQALGINTLLKGSDMPSNFVPAERVASEGKGYYDYAAPAVSSASNGFYNWMDPASWTEGQVYPVSPEAEALTLKTFEENGSKLYSGAGDAVPANNNHSMAVNQYFYAYPNSSVPSSNQEETDQTTKLVIECGVVISGTEYTYYYPISIPYIQPNYAYTIGNVRITRLGSTDPFKPVTTAQCEYTITVRNWDTGDIVGQYNNETGSDSFEI